MTKLNIKQDMKVTFYGAKEKQAVNHNRLIPPRNFLNQSISSLMFTSSSSVSGP